MDQAISYEAFVCERCEEENDEFETIVDNYGRYTIDCYACGFTHRSSSLAEDKADYFNRY